MTDQKRVLIVEDEVPLSRALELKLSHEGFSVTAKSNGREALEELKSQKYDVVLLDLMMPEVDGFQVLQELKNLSKEMPYVIVLSNLSQQEDEARVLSLGAKKYFIKSNTPLSAIVEEVKKI